MTPQEQIAIYLTNETLLYQDWYKEISLFDEDPAIHRIAQVPSLDELKARFQQWCIESLPTFKEAFCCKQLGNETFCQKWKRLRKKYPDFEHIMSAILIDVTFFHPLHTPVVLTILATSGCIEKLCEEC